MALYYTIDEFIKQVQNELKNLNVYTGMLAALADLEQTLFEQREALTTKETLLESAMVNADSVLQDVATALGAIDTTKFAFEVRVGSIISSGGSGVGGNYHHATIIVNAFDNWTIFSVDAEDVPVDAFDANSPATGITGLFSDGDKVEIAKLGNNFLEGVFTIFAEDAGFLTLEETNNPGAVSRSDVFAAVVRLRER